MNMCPSILKFAIHLRRKKMAAEHVTTLPCEPYPAHYVQRKTAYRNICTRANDIVYATIEDVRTFYIQVPYFTCSQPIIKQFSQSYDKGVVEEVINELYYLLKKNKLFKGLSILIKILTDQCRRDISEISSDS